MEKKVNIDIVYELGASSSHVNDPTLKNFLFAAVTLTKYRYRFYFKYRYFSFPGGGYSQNLLIFGVHMSFSAHIHNNNNKKRHISIGNRSNTRIRTYTNCRKNVLN